MRQVESNVAEALLRQDRYRYLAELTALTRNVPAVPREVYADADPASAVMLVEHYPHSDRPTVWLSACGATLVQEALDAVLGRLEEFALHSVDRSVFDALEATGQFSVAEVRCRRSFVCTAIGRVPPAQRRVAALTECDRDAFLAYPLGGPGSGPRRADLFRRFVEEGRGEVLAVRDGGGIMGYLSCNPEFEDVWDVEYVHVREEARRTGVGAALAGAYARRRLAAGQVPYWSGAANEASERTALKAGFVCCREQFYADVSARKR